ncbi:MAG: hypothetical protein JW814_09805 [Candidatus Krumholzibacteriota bacterium]|nr:hypothetical protein [Candidatus Krumholzibacteriota bacterium]
MKGRSFVLAAIIFMLAASGPTGVSAQDESAVFVVYGMMYADSYGTPSSENYFIRVVNATKDIEGVSELGNGLDEGKYKVVFLDFTGGCVVSTDDWVEIWARADGEEEEYLYERKRISQDDIGENRIMIDLIQGLISNDSTSWGAIKALLRE